MAGGLGAATGLLTTGLSLLGGAQQRKRSAEATAKGDIYESYNQRNLAQEGFVKAAQTNTAMTTHLDEVLANIKAVRASAGTEADSPTGTAILNRTESVGGQDISRSVRNIETEARQHEAAYQFYQQSAQDAIQAGSGGLFG